VYRLAAMSVTRRWDNDLLAETYDDAILQRADVFIDPPPEYDLVSACGIEGRESRSRPTSVFTGRCL
jgi:hypothetical protein